LKNDNETSIPKFVKKLIVGNNCVDDSGNKNGWKKWTLYLYFEEKEETGRFIEKVVVKLHQSFPNPVVELKPPFELTRMGWGVFEIVMTLYFHAETKKASNGYYMGFNFPKWRSTQNC